MSRYCPHTKRKSNAKQRSLTKVTSFTLHSVHVQASVFHHRPPTQISCDLCTQYSAALDGSHEKSTYILLLQLLLYLQKPLKIGNLMIINLYKLYYYKSKTTWHQTFASLLNADQVSKFFHWHTHGKICCNLNWHLKRKPLRIAAAAFSCPYQTTATALKN